MEKVKKINIGCGTDIRKGWINLDSVKLPGVDIVHDMKKLPLPFSDEEFEEILCQDVLEHVDIIPILQELHRILIKGGKITIRVPHFTSSTSIIDPTHNRCFSFRTFEFFTKGMQSYCSRHNYYFDFYFEKITYSKIGLHICEEAISPRVYRFIVQKLQNWVNYSRKRKIFYEDSFLSRIFPGSNIVVEMIK